mmetsp:Transcript_29877/g.75181  ORF Transcript_29877/g.75181 Transcript_29877/m.75181 type:complete len:220 (-) Transcript_29877:246-905(-)
MPELTEFIAGILRGEHIITLHPDGPRSGTPIACGWIVLPDQAGRQHELLQRGGRRSLLPKAATQFELHRGERGIRPARVRGDSGRRRTLSRPGVVDVGIVVLSSTVVVFWRGIGAELCVARLSVRLLCSTRTLLSTLQSFEEPCSRSSETRSLGVGLGETHKVVVAGGGRDCLDSPLRARVGVEALFTISSSSSSSSRLPLTHNVHFTAHPSPFLFGCL